MIAGRTPMLRRVVLLSGCLWAAPASAAVDGDWPCVQRRVGELGAAQMWGGPALEAGAPFRDEAGVRLLAAELAARRTPIEDAPARIERFAREAGRVKDARLTALFGAILERINGERGRLVAGIESFARKQRALAEKVKETSLALGARGAAAGGATGGPTASALEDSLRWDTRIYDERTAALTYVCESPVLLEQRAFALAREIQNHLD